MASRRPQATLVGTTLCQAWVVEAVGEQQTRLLLRTFLYRLVVVHLREPEPPQERLPDREHSREPREHRCPSSGVVLFVRPCALDPHRPDLRAKSNGLIVASDASDDLGVTRDLLRHVPTKGLWARLLSPSESLLKRRGFLPPESELPGQVYRTSPLWTQLAQALSFRLGAMFRRRSDHINLKEMDSYLAVEAALGFRDWESSRSLALLDSQVCLGSLLKGRSASFSINRRLCSALGGLLFFNLHPSCAYVASADNPSDDPTRLAPLRLPAIPEPTWLRLAERAALDSFLKECNLHPLQVQGFDTLAEKFAARDTSPGDYNEPSAQPDQPCAAFLPGFSSSGAVQTEAPGASGPGLGPSVGSFLHSCSRRQFLWPAGQRPPQHSVPSTPGYLCLYAGARGVAKAAVKVGFPWSLTFDWLHGAHQDLLDPRLQERVLESLAGHAFSAVGLSPGCPTFSAAFRPPLRSLDYPAGLPDLPASCSSRVCHDNKHCSFVVRVVRVAVSLGSLSGWRILKEAGFGSNLRSSSWSGAAMA